MAASRAPAWHLNLILFVLFCLFAACGVLIWTRRVAWHAVETIPGNLSPARSLVPYVFDSTQGTIQFLDTGERYDLPAEYRGKMEISSVSPSRTSFLFNTNEADGNPLDRCWNMTAHREMPVPPGSVDERLLSPSGTRYLFMEVRDGEPRRFRILGLDGAVLQEQILPALEGSVREVRHVYSPEGRYLAVAHSDDSNVPFCRIYDMASGTTWPFADRFGGLSDEGVVWLKDAALNIDRSAAQTLRAVRLGDGQELWRTAVPEGVSDVLSFGGDRLGVETLDPVSVALHDARNGRRLCVLEKAEGSLQEFKWHRAGPKSFLVGRRSVWSLETGRRIPIAGDLPYIQFFDDGRRALVHLKCGWPGRIVELETGKELMQFRAPGEVLGPQVQLVGDRVLVSDWDRVTNSPLPTEVWERRYPEGWKGHLMRPEIYAAIFLGAAILVVWANRPRHESIPGASQE